MYHVICTGYLVLHRSLNSKVISSTESGFQIDKISDVHSQSQTVLIES